MNPFGIIKGFNILKYQTICLLIITYFKPVQPFPFDKCMNVYYGRKRYLKKKK